MINADITIDSKIPIPPLKGRPPKWPFGRLKMWQSFLMSNYKCVNDCSNIIHYARKSLGRKFVSRTTPEGVRVWRVPNTHIYAPRTPRPSSNDVILPI